jgi:hypothetical protein
MTLLVSLLLSIATLSIRPLPEGTQLHVRLTTAVGSYASVPGSVVRAVLIAPVKLDGEIILAAGSTLAGRVQSVTRVGLGLRHETAGLGLAFDRITPLGRAPVPLVARVSDVDNGRERVTADGRIHGVRSTGSMSYRVSGYIRTMLEWEVHAELAEWAIRSLLMEVPEPEIYYPAGVELTLTLTRALVLPPAVPSEQDAARTLSNEERGELSDIVAALPDRTKAVSGRISDLTNVLLIGSRGELADSFEAAGWNEPGPDSFRDRIHWIRAAGELRGDKAAPMSLLLLNGEEPDVSWQKGLNDVAKRHHIRLWQAGTWRGRQMWIGAATRDVDFAYLRPGKKLAHKIDEDVDAERDKVAYDLAFSECGSILDWVDRPGVPQYTRNSTGDPIATDGRIVVVELNDCPEPRLATETVDIQPLPAHGGRLQRFTRREILGARNDVLRTNPYWRSFEACRWLVDYVRERRKRNAPDPVRLGLSARIRAEAVSRLH